MKSTFRIAALGLFLAAASLGAQAQTYQGPANNDYSSWKLASPGQSYIGINAGRSNYSLGNGRGVYGSERRDNAYGINAGTYFSRNFGVELGYTDFGDIRRAGGRTEAQGVNLSLIGRAPVSDSFNILGKVGTTYSRTRVSSAIGSGVPSGSESGFGLSYGIGAEWAFSPAWSAVVQWDRHDMKFANQGRDKVSATTVGLRYRF